MLFVLHDSLPMHLSFLEPGERYADRVLKCLDAHSPYDVEYHTRSELERRKRHTLVVAVHSTFVISVEREWQ